jgi:hypothetical protein
MKHVHHALRAAPGLVSIKVLATCLVPHPAFACPATYGARKVFPVDTNAREFVAKHAQKDTAISVAAKKMLVLTSLK